MRAAAERVRAAYADVRGGRNPPGATRARHRVGRHPAAPLRPRHRRLAAHVRPPRHGGRGDARWYVGRLAVEDDEHTPLVVDWRAPVAEPFYRATAIAPMGVVRRRHLITRQGREVIGLDDEVFDQSAVESRGPASHGRGRAARRARTQPHRPHGRHRRDDPGRAGRGDPGRRRRARWSSRADRVPARPRSRCTAPRTSSTRTVAGSRRKACCSSGRARCSSATSSTCCRRSANRTCSSRRSPGLKPRLRVDAATSPRSPR